MPRYTKTCQKCGKPFSEAGICCDSGTDGEGGHINGRCVGCCHGTRADTRTSLRRGDRVRVTGRGPGDHAAAGRVGTFVEYTTPRGYARVGLDPKPEWKDREPDVWLVHPESLEML